MPINLTASEREQEKVNHTILLNELADVAENRIKSILSDSYTHAANIYEETGDINTASVSTIKYQIQISNELQSIYKTSGAVFSSRIFERMDYLLSGKKSLYGLSTKDAESTYDLLFNEWVAAQAFTQAQLITDTTRDDLVELIQAAKREDLTNSLVAQLIKDKLAGQISASRAATIAITEVGMAASFASSESMKILDAELDLSTNKTWLTVDDTRTRPDHVAVDEVTIPLESKFTVGGVVMDRPRDPAGGGQAIRCRCTLSYETKEL